MNLNEETQNAINKVIAEKVPEIIEKNAEKAIKDIIEDMFRWDSDIKKQIKTKISECLNINLMKFDLIDYNALIAETINKNLVEQVNLEPIQKMISETIGFIDKTEITLQEIADLVIEGAKEGSSDGEGKITFIVEESDYSWLNIYADFEADKKPKNCAIRFVIYRDKEGNFRNMGCFSIEDIWNNNKNITPFKAANLSGVEQKIFRIYSAQVKITELNDSIDTYWTKYE
ncbi:hypothetical protein EG240_06000 [Paenimyroides tangerinum]|uniref:Uncharacterized protein n=1 Tax=Paenimyroides tangerinum TaxID=2488728 RepID=A0A3P3W8T0_9FLAO|nr:hypothetical protein [Paenimyroides tangerinum]RRJ91555.1 hypothetical protein EG240_06000 [Paenimyroides tangerinum]